MQKGNDKVLLELLKEIAEHKGSYGENDAFREIDFDKFAKEQNI